MYDQSYPGLVKALRTRGRRVTKNQYVFHLFDSDSFYQLVWSILGIQIRLNMNKMKLHLMDTHPEWLSGIKHEAIFVLPKAKFKRWLKQNVNRFRVNYNEIEKQEEEFNRQEYERTCRETFEDMLDSEEESVEDAHDPAMESHYGDDYDRYYSESDFSFLDKEEVKA